MEGYVKWFLQKWGGYSWFGLQRDRGQDVVNRVMNSGLHKTRGIFLLAEELLAYRERFCTVELGTYNEAEYICPFSRKSLFSAEHRSDT